jgi:hypothetical protein
MFVIRERLYAHPVDQKYLGSFEMWCWRRMEEISWTDRARNVEVLYTVKKEKKNIVHTVKGRKDMWIGHSLRRKCLLKHVTYGKMAGRSDGNTRNKR